MVSMRRTRRRLLRVVRVLVVLHVRGDAIAMRGRSLGRSLWEGRGGAGGAGTWSRRSLRRRQACLLELLKERSERILREVGKLGEFAGWCWGAGVGSL